MSQKAESLRETAYAFCAGLYPANNAAPDWKKEQYGLKFSFGDYGEFTVEGVELDSVETSAKVTENGQETTEQHKFYRYSKSTAEGTTSGLTELSMKRLSFATIWLSFACAICCCRGRRRGFCAMPGNTAIKRKWTFLRLTAAAARWE